MNIAEIVKECAMKAYDASIPCDVLFGVVEEVDPVKVRIGEMVLEGDIISVAKNLLYRDYELRIGVNKWTIVIEEGLKTGDSVAILRQSGGGRYTLIAKI